MITIMEQVSFDVLSFMKKDNIITSDKGLLSVVIFLDVPKMA